MTLRNLRVLKIEKRKHQNALCGALALEKAMDLSLRQSTWRRWWRRRRRRR